MREPDRTLDVLREELSPDYEVKRVVGEGSAATVYLAWDRGLARSVALKLPRRETLADEWAVRRFEREAQAAGQLISDHVAIVHRLARLDDGTPYLVMQYVNARTISDRLAAEGALPPEAALEVLRGVASALVVAHREGIVHRAVNPTNVLWDADQERALLVDFGFARLVTQTGEDITRLTRSGEWRSDVRYLTPEQLEDEQVSCATDVYLLGVMGYELLTGEGPYDAVSMTDWIEAHLEAAPKDLRLVCPGLDKSIAGVLGRCLNKKPSQRPTAGQVLRALEGEWVSDPTTLRDALGDQDFVQTVGWGFLASGFIIGGTATLDQQYDWVPSWAFTEALLTGAAVLLAFVVHATHERASRAGRTRTWRSVLLLAMTLAWTVATLLVIPLFG